MMNDCKDCRHYRNGLLDRWVERYPGEFARCAHYDATQASFTRVMREFDHLCGQAGWFFEPIPLGHSHGIDWDRVEAAVRERFFEALDAFTSPDWGRDFDDTTPRSHFTVAEYLAALTTDYCAAEAAE